MNKETGTKRKETATPSEKSDIKRTCHGVNHSIHPSPAAPPLSPIRFQRAAHPQTQVWSSGKARRLAQVGVSNPGVNMGSS